MFIFWKLTLQRAAQTSYRPRADSGLYGFRVQTETITIARSLRDILFILELPFLNLNRSRFLSVVGVSFRQYIPVHLQHKILDQLAKQNNHKLLWERSKKKLQPLRLLHHAATWQLLVQLYWECGFPERENSEELFDHICTSSRLCFDSSPLGNRGMWSSWPGRPPKTDS